MVEDSVMVGGVVVGRVVDGWAVPGLMKKTVT